MEPALGQLFSCVDADPVRRVFGCMTDTLVNGIRVRATELVLRAWKIDHHVAEDGNISFSFELTYLSQKVHESCGGSAECGVYVCMQRLLPELAVGV